MNKSSKPNKSGAARRGSKQAKSVKPKKRNNNLGQSRSVQAPISQGRVSVMSRPQTRSSPNGDVIIKHREFVQDILGSQDFTVLTVPINPGLSQTFPWLATIASSFESYQFEDLHFRIETQCTTVTSGTVVTTVDYDPNDQPPTSKAQALAYRGAVRSPPWSSSDFHAIREDLTKRKSYYVRRGILGNAQDISLYDTGKLYICTQGQSDNSTLTSELYVDYTVKLMTPQLFDLAVGEAIYGRYTGNTNMTKFQNKTGNISIDVVNLSSTQVEFHFLKAWEGYMDIQLTGTTLLPLVLGVSTVDVTVTQNLLNAGATQLAASLNVRALINQVLTLTLGNATITDAIATFGQADVAS